LTAREAAFSALEEYRKGRPADEAIYHVQTRSGMSGRDVALAVRLIKGVLQNMSLLDYYAAFFSSVDVKRIEPRALGILRMSIYQLVFLTKIPGNAAVNEGVELAKKIMGKRGAGFVNAVLRKAANAAENGSFPEITGDSLKSISIKYSHPEWLVKEFETLIGREGLVSLLKANNESDVPITAQVNTLLTDIESVLAMLKEDGLEAVRHEWLDGCVQFKGTGAFDRTEVFKKGYIYIQDVAARLAVMAASPEPGDLVVDGCAAPGGKSFAAAIMMKNQGRILAMDINADRLRLVDDGARRLKIDIIEAIVKDAASGINGDYGDNTGIEPRADSINAIERTADVVFADVPCSGFGVIRKKPDIRYKSKREIANLPEIQSKILESLSMYVKPGGVLIYSTCTVLKQENESVIDGFLRKNNCFATEGFNLPGLGGVQNGSLTLWPHIHGTDGFFICKLRRNNSI